MENRMPETDIDITGAVLTPGKPELCQGNGKNPDFECCCDECDWFLLCYGDKAEF